MPLRSFMDSRKCKDASCPVDGVDRSRDLKKRRTSFRCPTLPLFQWSFLFLSCTIILAFIVIPTTGLATGRHILPVIRSFSQLEGSGAKEGSYGMSAEHARELWDHDFQRNLRNRRALTTVADFPLAGNEYNVGLYYTQIGLGTPSANYYVQVDTGSDLLWVNCKPCEDCPSESSLQIPLRLYNPQASSTSENTSCSSTACKSVATIADNPCVDNSCYYSFGYGDGSTAMGYLVDDKLTYDTVVTNNAVMNASATVFFGCGFNQTGDSLTSESQAVDGIMGFGRQGQSVVSQLANKDLTTNAFAHCLQGDTGEGGIFVIGDVNETGIVYTDLVPKQYHYNVVLESIAVGGKNLPVSPSVFDANSFDGEGGTIFDSGTTLAYLVDTAYDAFVNQLTTDVGTVPSSDTPCFEVSDSDLSSTFPNVTLTFQGGALMELEPTNYLYKRSGSSSKWCLAWSASTSSGLNGQTILGDIVLKNKLVVYDLGKEQIGWVNYNCLSSVQVSNGTGNQVFNPAEGNLLEGSPSHSIQVYPPDTLLICLVVLAYALIFL